MNKLDFVVEQDLLQDVLNYIATSNSNLPAGKIVQLVDRLRSLKPQQINNVTMMTKSEEETTSNKVD